MDNEVVHKIYTAAMINKIVVEYQIRAMAMAAENQMRAATGCSPAYDQSHFFALVDEMEAYIQPHKL